MKNTATFSQGASSGLQQTDEGERLLPIGTAVSQCGACGEVFASVYAFDLHRVGDGDHRRCLTTEEMAARGMAVNARRRWVSHADDRER